MLSVHTVGLVNENKSGFVYLFLDFFERFGNVCELGLEFIETALLSLVVKNLLNEF